MNKLMYLWFAVKTIFCTCQPDHKINDFEKVRSHYKISKIGKLPAVASESSGLANGSAPGLFVTHNDSGGKPELYEFDLSGKLTATKPVPDARNVDWEDLGKDADGNFYIGDFGNNGAPRNQFEIYKFNSQNGTEKISFRYTDQKSLAGVSNKPAFDCESLFYFQKNLYLFSKNWGKNKFVRLYRVPAEAGNYTIMPIDSIQINTQVTAANVSPDGKTFALLTYGKILLFAIENDRIDFSKPRSCFRLVKKQNEALMFLNNTDMLVTNEQGDIYQITYK
ncbi:esterase-like activity of phytase family protein [Dyadobacter sp. LJ53]|uniref:esterase-like activity of phytase family protein n=1 Tax=Dyadobacter chenwenxiniae TaxID=2906456 RepID=UPI001F2FA3F9|nr:esterase-like activity of phytase family protein [Dyadobacter chenwenxiniae]MCF0049587.1 esterase-like activity of phytase family protein [Dyadobacter chenwenxiniae]